MISFQGLELERLGDPGEIRRPPNRPTYKINYQIAKDLAKIRESKQDFTIYRRVTETVRWQVWKEETGESWAQFTQTPFGVYKENKQ